MSTTPVPVQFDDAVQQRDAASLGIWAFLVSEVLFFGGLFTAYTIYRVTYPAAFAAASHELYELIGAFNTAVLLASSLTVALAVAALEHGAVRRAGRLVLATLALGGVFLALKSVEYWLDYREGLVPGLHFEPARFADAPHAALFLTLYFIMTGLHALHVISGLGVLGVIRVLLARSSQPAALTNTLENAALFWHLVDVVWIFLFPLLYLPGAQP
jgi:cytochrome c oxidase subunit III